MCGLHSAVHLAIIRAWGEEKSIRLWWKKRWNSLSALSSQKSEVIFGYFTVVHLLRSLIQGVLGSELTSDTKKARLASPSNCSLVAATVYKNMLPFEPPCINGAEVFLRWMGGQHSKRRKRADRLQHENAASHGFSANQIIWLLAQNYILLLMIEKPRFFL